MKYKKWVVTTNLILSISLSAIIFFHSWYTSPVECHSNVRIFNRDGEMKLLFSYSMKEGAGVANIAGAFFENDKMVGTVSRTATFNYTNNNNIFTMHSTDVARSGLDKFDDEFLSQYLPRFYLFKDVPLIITITPQLKSGWIFSTGKVPSFYCEKRGA